MPGTRSKAGVDVVSGTEAAAATPNITYTNGTLPEVWIADGAAEEYSIIVLPDPKSSEPRRFVQRGCTSLGELRTFSSATPASFLVHPDDIPSHRGSADARPEDESPVASSDCDQANAGELAASSEAKDCQAFTTKQTLHVVTEIDVIFALLPVLCPTPDSKAQDDGFRMRFLPFDDITENWGDMEGSQATQLMESRIWRDKIHESLERICDVVEAGDEKAYGFSLAKFQTIITRKATQLAEAGLPQTLDDQALRLAENTEIAIAAEEEHSADTPTAVGTPGELSVATNDTQESVVSAVFTPRATEYSPISTEDSGQNKVQKLARVRVALGFILANYVPEHVSAEIVQRIDADASTSTDFQELHDLVKRKRAADKRVDVSRLYASKRSAEDDIRSEERAEKKRKLDEEEKKRKEASHGVKSLAKVNVKGMAKMTSFFQAKSKS